MSRPLVIAVLAAMTLAGCAASRDRIVLLPGPDGRTGSVAVLAPGGGGVLLSGAYDSAEIDDRGRVSMQRGQDDRWRLLFADTLGALPTRPVLYLLYFKSDSDQLTEESKAEAPEMLREVARRPAAEVVVIGHTDSFGPAEYNDQLSLARADQVRRQLIGLGFDPGLMKIEGRGEREPLVPTADGVHEPNNRRAEINVR